MTDAEDGSPQATGAYLRVPVGPLSEILLRSVMCGGRAALERGWRAVPGGGAFSASNRPGALRILYRAVGADLASGLHGFDPLLLDVTLVLLDLFCRQPDGGRSSFAIFTRPKQYQRWGDERRALHASLERHLRRLQAMAWLGGEAPEPVFRLELAEAGGDSFFAAPGPRLRQELADCVSTSLPLDVLRLDHRANRGADGFAKKIAAALASGGRDRRYRDLLARIGELPPAGSEARQGRIAARCARAEARLAKLCGFHARPAMPEVRTKGWVKAWLNTPVGLQPPFPAALRPPGSRTAPRPRLQTSLTPRNVRQKRGAGAAGRGLQPASAAAPAPRGRGRPAFRPTPEDRTWVAAQRACGELQDALAKQLGISRNTLRRHFAVELAAGGRPDGA